jgi:hypothetical protein
LGWRNAPKPILTALEAGRNKLVNVLGVTDEIKSSKAAIPVETEVIELYQSLSPAQQEEIRYEICTQ